MNNNVIEVTPDKEGKYYITLYGTKYQVVIKEAKKKKEDKPLEEVVEDGK